MKEIPGVEFHGDVAEIARYVELLTSLTPAEEKKLLEEVEEKRRMIREEGGRPLVDLLTIKGEELSALLTYPDTIISYAEDAPVSFIVCFRGRGEELLRGGFLGSPAGPKRS